MTKEILNNMSLLLTSYDGSEVTCEHDDRQHLRRMAMGARLDYLNFNRDMRGAINRYAEEKKRING